MYAKKAEGKLTGDSIMTQLHKLLLNSLYGKCGEKEPVHSFSFLDSEKFALHEKKKNIDLVQVFGNKVLARENKGRPIPPKVLSLLNIALGKANEKIAEVLERTKIVQKTQPRLEDIGGGSSLEREGAPLVGGLPKEEETPSQGRRSRRDTVKSSVPIAAATTAYGRIIMSKFKNIKGNDYYGGDTDSVILESELPPRFIGPEIGKMKLEEIIKSGLLAGKKLYYTQNNEGKYEVKSRGIGKDVYGKSILTPEDFISLAAGRVIAKEKPK